MCVKYEHLHIFQKKNPICRLLIWHCAFAWDKAQRCWLFIWRIYSKVPSEFNLCVLCWGTSSWNNSSRRNYAWGKKLLKEGLSCLLHFRCVWSQSVTNTPFTLHVKNPFIWSRQHRGAPTAPVQKYCSQRQQKTTDVPLLFLINKRLTFAALLIEHCTLYFCQRIPLTFTSNSCLRAPERMMWGRQSPKIGCLFI